MKYKEIIDLYKSGKLDEKQKTEIENDIERHQAISEYLIDIEEQSDFSVGGLFEDIIVSNNKEDNNITDTENVDRTKDEFTKSIRKSIRNTFIKTGVCTGVIVLAIVCFVIFAVPKIVDSHYYDPGKNIGTCSRDTNQMSLDMAVYSELFLPGRYRDNVTVSRNGYGKYDISILQTARFSDNSTTIGGVINKGKIITYDNNYFNNIAVNKFVSGEEIVKDEFIMQSNDEDKEETYANLDKLNELDSYITFVSLDSVMNYNEFIKWSKEKNIQPIWCKLCFKKNYNDIEGSTSNEEDSTFYSYNNIGFIPGSSCGDLYFDEKNYPFLTQFSLSKEMKDFDPYSLSANVIEKHVSSMLLYIANQTDFREMMELDVQEEYLKAIAEEINTDGINICGFVMVGDKESICALRDISEISYISTSHLRYE